MKSILSKLENAPSFPWWITAPALIILLILIAWQDAYAAVNRDRAAAVIERRLKRLERLQVDTEGIVPSFRGAMEKQLQLMEQRIAVAVRGIQALIDDTKHELCLLGADAYCPVIEEPIPDLGEATISFDVQVSKYNPVTWQTDASPCSGAFGDVCQLYEDGRNPVAVSQDIAIWPLPAGSQIYLESLDKREMCKQANGVYQVADTMNERYHNAVDIFVPCKDSDCIEGVGKARAFGRCSMRLTKMNY